MRPTIGPRARPTDAEEGRRTRCVRYVPAVSKGSSFVQATRQRVRRWWPWLVLSAILHLPFTPVGQLLGLLSLLARLRDVPVEPVEEFTGIPVEILTDQKPADDTAAPLAKSETAGEEVVVVPPPKAKPPKKPKLEPIDAGIPDAASDAGATDAGPDAGIADASVTTDAGIGDAGSVNLADAGTAPGDDAGVLDAGAHRPDPFAIAGELAKFQKGNVNVRVHFFVERLKQHPAGSVITELLLRDPQWQEFLGPSGLDPLEAFSKIVIMGPQLVDSSQVGVFLEYKANASAIRKAVDALVQRTEGAHWETKNKKPVAYVRAAGGDRVIILYPNHGLAIVPPKPAEQLIGLSKFPPMISPSDDDEVLQLMLKTPYRVRAFKRAGLEVPKSIALARVFVGATQNGGASIRIELDDESPEAANTHAPDLERELAKLSMGVLSLRLRVEGTTIVGETRVSPLIVAGILRDVQKRLLPKDPNPR